MHVIANKHRIIVGEETGARIIGTKGGNYEILDAIESQCLRNPGKAVVIGGPGSRGAITNFRRFKTHEHGTSRVF